MYLSYYNLNIKPFSISSDPNFLWLGEKHKEALAILKYGILANKGFLLLTGDVGTGKTTLINALINSLGDDFLVAKIHDPGLEQLDFFNFVADSLNIKEKFDTKGAFLLHLTDFLISTYKQNKRVLLIIDEAQRLRSDLLEEIRLLSNIEMQHTKLINIFFVGQSEFNEILAERENRALRQRVTIVHDLEPLDESETAEYIKSRLRVAGSEKNLFNSGAIREIFNFSGGYPRLINIICDHALLTGFSKEKKTINAEIIRECADELQIPVKSSEKDQNEQEPIELLNRIPTPVASNSKETFQIVGPARKKRFRLIPVFIVLLFFLMIGASGSFFYFGEDRSTTLVREYWNRFFDHEGSNTTMIKIRDEYPEANKEKSIDEAPINVGKENQLSEFEITTEEEINEENEINVSDTNQEEKNILPKISTLNGVEDNEISDTAIIDQPVEEKTLSVSIPKVSENDMPSESLIDTNADDTDIVQTDIQTNLIVFFNSNSYELTDDSIEKLDQFLPIIAKRPYSEIEIKGYTDTTGPPDYNQKLSIFRAYSVKSYLVSKGVSPLRAKTLGMDMEELTKKNSGENAGPYSRRVEIDLKISEAE